MINKNFTNKVKVKKILVSSRAKLILKEKEPYKILDDESRFFNGEFNQEKRRMFLS